MWEVKEEVSSPAARKETGAAVGSRSFHPRHSLKWLVYPGGEGLCKVNKVKE